MVAHKLLVVGPKLDHRAAEQAAGGSAAFLFGEEGGEDRAHQQVFFDVFGFSVAARGFLVPRKILGELLLHEHVFFHHQHARQGQAALFLPALVVPLNVEWDFHEGEAWIGIGHAGFLFHRVQDLPEGAGDFPLGVFKKFDGPQVRGVDVKGAGDVVNGGAIYPIDACVEREHGDGFFNDPAPRDLRIEGIGGPGLALGDDFEAARVRDLQVRRGERDRARVFVPVIHACDRVPTTARGQEDGFVPDPRGQGAFVEHVSALGQFGSGFLEIEAIRVDVPCVLQG